MQPTKQLSKIRDAAGEDEGDGDEQRSRFLFNFKPELSQEGKCSHNVLHKQTHKPIRLNRLLSIYKAKQVGI